MESYKKPPLGVMSKYIWKEHRVIELADGIIRKTAEGYSTDEGVVQWALEIVELLQQIKQEKGYRDFINHKGE